MARERWFYAREMRRVGPLPKHRLVESLLALPDAGDCLIWRPGLPAWTPSRDVPEIDRQLAPFVKAETVPAPEPALAALSQVAALILLETCVSRGDEDASPTVPEELTMNQAIAGVGSRPTRTWVLHRLQKYWGNGYISVTQPAHPDFPTDWSAASSRPLTRAIFVGSKTPLANPALTSDIPTRQEQFVSRA